MRDLEELNRLYEAATPGEWRRDDFGAWENAITDAWPEIAALLRDVEREFRDMVVDAHVNEHNHLTNYQECTEWDCIRRAALLSRLSPSEVK